MKNLLLVLFLLGANTAFAQKTESSIAQLMAAIQKTVEKQHITGLMLGITTRDTVLFAGGFGYADRPNKRKTDANTLFRMGSITKMFVSLGIMKLVEQGKLNLNDEVRKIVPELPFQNKWQATNPLRIVHLLEHTSGFDDIKLNKMYSLDATENTGIDAVLVHKNSMICRWQPGERFAYSNPNYAVLGYIIEKISGKPYDEYLSENILKPLGMTNSNFNLSSKFPQKDTKEYVFKNGKTTAVPSVTAVSGPPCALWSSANDMLKFLQLFLRKGDTLFTKKTIDAIENTHSAPFALHSDYALGNASANSNGKFLWRGHDGLTGTCYSDCFYNHELNIGFVISSNSNNDNYEIWKLIISFLEKNKTAAALVTQALDPKTIPPFLGYYQFESPRNEISGFSDKLQNLAHIYRENQKLYYKPLLGEATELLQTAPLTFALKGSNTPQFVFIKNTENKNLLYINGAYYEQTTAFGAFIKRITLLIALFFAFSTFILGFVSLFAMLFKKLAWKIAFFRILPMFGLSFLLLSVYFLLDVRHFTYKLSTLGTINPITSLIFFGTLFFGLIAILHLLHSIAIFLKSKTWLEYYLLFSGFSFCFIAFILYQNGWIGLRTWML